MGPGSAQGSPHIAYNLDGSTQVKIKNPDWCQSYAFVSFTCFILLSQNRGLYRGKPLLDYSTIF